MSLFHASITNHSALSNLVTRSLPSRLNLSTGEKPRGEEDKRRGEWVAGQKQKQETEQDSETEGKRKQQGQEASVGEKVR